MLEWMQVSNTTLGMLACIRNAITLPNDVTGTAKSPETWGTKFSFNSQKFVHVDMHEDRMANSLWTIDEQKTRMRMYSKNFRRAYKLNGNYCCAMVVACLNGPVRALFRLFVT